MSIRAQLWLLWVALVVVTVVLFLTARAYDSWQLLVVTIFSGWCGGTVSQRLFDGYRAERADLLAARAHAAGLGLR